MEWVLYVVMDCVLQAILFLPCVVVQIVLQIALSDCDWLTSFYRIDEAALGDAGAGGNAGVGGGGAERGAERRTAWVLGATSGIGKLVALELGRRGMRVAISGRRQDKLDEVRDEMMAEGATDVVVHRCDVACASAALVECGEKALALLGGRMDYFFDNAGVFHYGNTTLAEEYEMLVTTSRSMSVLGTWYVHKMRQRGSRGPLPSTAAKESPHTSEQELELKSCRKYKAHLVVTSSIAAGVPSETSVAYSAAKCSVQSLFSAMQWDEMGDDIAITTILPGPVDTPMYQLAAEAMKKDRRLSMASMKTSRCAELILVAASNELKSSWTCLKPVLGAVYAAVYFPSLVETATNGLTRIRAKQQTVA